jgi:hypothetical protein
MKENLQCSGNGCNAGIFKTAATENKMLQQVRAAGALSFDIGQHEGLPNSLSGMSNVGNTRMEETNSSG